jgi:hypothetical protein
MENPELDKTEKAKNFADTVELELDVSLLAFNKAIKDVKDMLDDNKLFEVKRIEKFFNLNDHFNELFNEAHEELMDYVKNDLEVAGRTIEHLNIEILDVLTRSYLNKLNEEVQSFAFNFEQDVLCN